MQRIHIFLFCFFAIFQTLSAKNPTPVFHFPTMAASVELTCQVPPPASLSVDEIGPDWVRVSWPSALLAVQYRLQAFDGTTGEPLATPLVVPASVNTAEVSTVGNEGTVYVRIWSVCANGTYDEQDFTQSDTVDTIIVELVVTGFNDFPQSFNLSQIGFGYQNGQPLPWMGDVAYFMAHYVEGPGDTIKRRFAAHVEAGVPGDMGGADVVKIHCTENGPFGNNEQHIVFVPGHHSPNNQMLDFLIGYRADLNTNPKAAEKAAFVTAGHPNANPIIPGKMYMSSAINNPKFKLYKVNPLPQWNNAFFPGTNSFKAQPNPFQEAINIQLPETKDPNGTVMHLYDLLGARRMAYVAPANQTECSLNTTQLEPGIYFLHLQSGGKTETIKLIKQ